MLTALLETSITDGLKSRLTQYLKHVVEDDVLFTNSNPLHYTQHSVVVNKCTYLLCIITLTEMHKTCVLKTIAVLLVRRQKKSIEENASSTDLSQCQVRLKNIIYT